MSGDLAQSLDPRLVGDRIAVHIARAVGADDCALSYWDRPTDRVITLGYEPPERRGALNESYAVDDFPATRQVLETQRPALIDVDDPAADAGGGRAISHSIGHRSMAMVPLVAAGRTIGLIEVTAARRRAFGDRAVELATMLAGEAAMALENARLYDEIRHQALHDGLTGLANRVLFRDRVEHAVERSRRSGGAARPPLHRPRRLQGPQRHPRPRPRRRGPRRGRGAGARRPPARRHRGPSRRRRVRGAPRGRRATRPTRSRSRPGSPSRFGSRCRSTRRRVRVAASIGVAMGSGDRERRRPAAQRRRRDVRGEAVVARRRRDLPAEPPRRRGRAGGPRRAPARRRGARRAAARLPADRRARDGRDRGGRGARPLAAARRARS